MVGKPSTCERSAFVFVLSPWAGSGVGMSMSEQSDTFPAVQGVPGIETEGGQRELG